MTKLDLYSRLAIIAIGAILVAVTVYASMVRIELSTTRFNELRSYIKTRDEKWNPFIARTDEHLDRQDRDLARVETLLKRLEQPDRAHEDRAKSPHP